MGRKKTTKQLEKKLAELKAKTPKFKLRLDEKTIITLSNIDKVSYWKTLYPNAKFI
jgi:ribosomal protein L29